ncbi:MAG: hypothetical protein E6I38_07535 [Chloroflexi bacterium]|nr:MAG: hypothetical protein E6I38_07535 [Chloroflexota bacterium]
MTNSLCAECDWKYSGTMGHPVEAAKRHKLTHVFEKCGGTGAVKDVIESFLVSERLNSTDAQYAPR